MRIGLDLDNTLVCYDTLFYRLALERGLIDATCPPRKQDIRDAVRREAGDAAWQALQGDAYGPRMCDAVFFSGVPEALRLWRTAGHELCIVSHKTRFSSVEKFDLHSAALDFLRASALLRQGLLHERDIYFCRTRDEKIDRIANLRCHVFVDDLPEIFLHPAFPRDTRQWFFAPRDKESVPQALTFSAWEDIQGFDPAFENSLFQGAGAFPQRLHRLGGGRNSRVWAVELPQGTVVLKAYHRSLSDQRHRLEHEHGAFDLLHEYHIHDTPRTLHVDTDLGVAVYSHIQGQPYAPNTAGEKVVQPFVALTARLHMLARALPTERAASIPWATDACKSLTIWEQCVEDRLERLLTRPRQNERDEEMADFVTKVVSPAWRRHRDKARDVYARLQRDPVAVLAEHERTLSPSDMGFHNALRKPDGSLAFVDFEYFGWDDPTKLLSDFVLHPGMHLTENQQHFFIDTLLERFAMPDLEERLQAMRPLFATAWCCILLNEFLKDGTRNFILPQKERARLCSLQLARARDFFNQHMETTP